MPDIDSFFKHLIKIETLSYLLGRWWLTPRLHILMFWPFFLSSEFRCHFLISCKHWDWDVAGWARDYLSSDCFTAIFLFGSQAPSPHTQTMNRVRGPSVFRLFHGWLFDWLTGSISTNSNNAQSFNVSPNCDTPALKSKFSQVLTSHPIVTREP